LKKKHGFSKVSRHLSQPPSDLRQELLSSGTHGAKSFQGHWKEIIGPAERAVFVYLPSSCSLSFIYYLIVHNTTQSKTQNKTQKERDRYT